jgi:uncharacterized protein GlcG (DUF336 family)
VLSSNASAQGLVSQKNIPLAMAKTIAEAAMDKCKELGFKVSVVVVDRAGLPLVMLRGDGAGLHTPEGADRKAYTARTFGTSSTDFVKRTERPGLDRLQGIQPRARDIRRFADQSRR